MSLRHPVTHLRLRSREQVWSHYNIVEFERAAAQRRGFRPEAATVYTRFFAFFQIFPSQCDKLILLSPQAGEAQLDFRPDIVFS